MNKELYKEAVRVVDLYGLDTVAGQFAYKIILEYEKVTEKVTSFYDVPVFGVYNHRLTPDQLPSILNSLSEEKDQLSIDLINRE